MSLFGLFPSPSSLDVLLRLPPLYIMDTILLSDMGLKWIPEEDENGTSTTTVFSSPGGREQIRIKSIENESSGAEEIFDDSGGIAANWSLEAAYWRLYGNPDWAVVPYAINFMACLYVYLVCAFVVTLATR